MFGIFPVALGHGVLAMLSPAGIGLVQEGLVALGRTVSIGVAFFTFAVKFLYFARERNKEKSKEEYELELMRAGQPKIDLPKDMSVFTLWEMNRFIKKKQDSSSQWLGSEWFDRSEPEPDETDDEQYNMPRPGTGSYGGSSSPYRTGKGSNNNGSGFMGNERDKSIEKSKKKITPLFSDSLRNKPNLSSSADDDETVG